MHLLHLSFPSLISLHIYLQNPYWFRDTLESLPDSSPNLRELIFCIDRSDTAFNKIFSDCIRRWKKLQAVTCLKIDLDMDALLHLSRMPNLNRLNFALSTTLLASDSPLVFSKLHYLSPRSKLLDSTSQFLSQTRLPATVKFNVIVDKCPSKQELQSFWASFRTSGAGHTIKYFSLDQSPSLPRKATRSETLLLGFEDLQPCMAFGNLGYLDFDIERAVSLTDSELLALASEWPHLKCLSINPVSGWYTRGGITPNGVFQLLQQCQSLFWIVLALDTRGYTELPVNGLLESVGYAHASLWLNVVDSVIEAESIPAVAAFFAPTPHSSVSLCAHFGGVPHPPGLEVYLARWRDVRERVNIGVGENS